jgi:hypothetical protein
MVVFNQKTDAVLLMFAIDWKMRFARHFEDELLSGPRFQTHLFGPKSSGKACPEGCLDVTRSQDIASCRESPASYYRDHNVGTDVFPANFLASEDDSGESRHVLSELAVCLHVAVCVREPPAKVTGDTLVAESCRSDLYEVSVRLGSRSIIDQSLQRIDQALLKPTMLDLVDDSTVLGWGVLFRVDIFNQYRFGRMSNQ